MNSDLPHDYNMYLEGARMSGEAARKCERRMGVSSAATFERIKLLGYYERRRHTEKSLRPEYVKLNLWFIEHRPNLSDHMWYIVGRSANACTPREFAEIRCAWLEHVRNQPNDAKLIGHAGMSIILKDIEMGTSLLKKAHELAESDSLYSGWIAIHHYFEFCRAPRLYKKHYASTTIAAGTTATKLETTACFQIFEYLIDCFIFLNDLNAARHYVAFFSQSDFAPNRQTADAFAGLIALKEGDKKKAVKCMMTMNKGYGSHQRIWQLANALYDADERESIIACISQYKNKLKASTRNRWISQIRNGARPDFRED